MYCVWRRLVDIMTLKLVQMWLESLMAVKGRTCSTEKLVFHVTKSTRQLRSHAMPLECSAPWP